jgi:hypothetical protein
MVAHLTLPIDINKWTGYANSDLARRFLIFELLSLKRLEGARDYRALMLAITEYLLIFLHSLDWRTPWTKTLVAWLICWLYQFIAVDNHTLVVLVLMLHYQWWTDSHAGSYTRQFSDTIYGLKYCFLLGWFTFFDSGRHLLILIIGSCTMILRFYIQRWIFLFVHSLQEKRYWRTLFNLLISLWRRYCLLSINL